MRVHPCSRVIAWGSADAGWDNLKGYDMSSGESNVLTQFVGGGNDVFVVQVCEHGDVDESVWHAVDETSRLPLVSLMSLMLLVSFMMGLTREVWNSLASRDLAGLTDFY